MSLLIAACVIVVKERRQVEQQVKCAGGSLGALHSQRTVPATVCNVESTRRLITVYVRTHAM